ncbi:TPA: hypothetical protein DEF17_09300 [bacterium]|nr:MAG: hypothetical protein AUJ18_02955 [Candidatus Hydrogenedentes bacterium CG1_02_42_14]HBW48104.1 hypothetical protein [bacterium]
MRIAVVDKEEFQRRILILLLESIGKEKVESYASLEEISNQFHNEDIVIIDLYNFEKFQIVRDSKPFVIVSAQERHDKLLADSLSNGADSFILKPFTKEGLEQAIKDAKLMKETTI